MPGHAVPRNRRRWLVVALSIAGTLSLVAASLVGVKLLTGGWGRAPASSAGHPVPVHVVSGRKVRIPAMQAGQRLTVHWPAAGSGTAVITAVVAPRSKSSRSSALPTPGSVQAGGLPVWVGPPSSTSAASRGRTVTAADTSGSAVSRVQVSMASHAVANALGVHGIVFSISRTDGSLSAGRVHVSLDYAEFAHAYGGDYASRLRLVELPACALSTPNVARCRKWTKIPAGSADSVRVDRVGTNVLLPGTGTAAALASAGQSASTVLTAALSPAAADSAGVVLAALAGPAGSGGNFAASPLSDASEWVRSGNSGAFTYSYPVAVPQVPGGLEPTVNLTYDSQTTDGLTSATNNETSWVGDGWDYSPGFIEAPWETCSNAGGQNPATGDLCSPNPSQPFTLSFNGTNTSLISTKSGFRAAADQGAQIKEVTIPGSTQFYWEMIEPDGTQYYFGMNQLPGWTSGDPLTNSAWTVPVWEISTYTTQEWRWNLDYVVDSHGNAIAYFYNTQTNYYAEDNGTTGSAAYTHGGVLTKIEYGLRAGSIYGATPAGQVNFTTGTSRQDAPDDLACSSGAACSVTSPTFWSDDALTGISTQTLVGSSLRNVDSWALADSYPATGDSTTSPSLWLSSITHTGQDGTTSVALPPTSFGGTPMPNRVETAADMAAGYSLITRFRLTSITNETGGVTTIAYSSEDSTCAAGTFPAPDANATACYPAYWLPPSASSPVLDWFNMYTVKTATSTDTTGGDPPVVTSYTYAGAAWHYNDDSVVRSVTTTWDEWRGYRTVTTETGTIPDPVTETVDTYLQGMSGDYSLNCPPPAPFGCNPTATVTSSRGDAVTDSDGYAGLVFESIEYNGAGTGNQVTDRIQVPSGTTTGSDSSTKISSFMTENNVDKTYTTLAGGGTRESTETYTYNSYGEMLTDSHVPDTSNPAEDTCTTVTYDTNTTTYLVDLPATVQVVDLPCGTTPTQASQLVSDLAYTYDNGSSSPTAGNLTKAQQATSATVQDLFGQYMFQYTYGSTDSYTYDEYGRPLTSTDPDNRTTTTAYTPSTGVEPTSVQATDPAGLITTTTYDPARDLPLTVTDPAGDVTAKAYDALGRVTSAWTPGNPASGPAVDTYSYTVSNTAPSVVTEQPEEPGGGYLTDKTIYDSLGQVRETQQETAGGGTDVTDTSYDSNGWKALASNPYYTTGAPSGTLVAAGSGSVPSQTGYVYDGDGRLVKQIAYALGTETWETDTSYGGNYVTVVPPSGGIAETTFTDGRDLTTAIYQYHAGVSASPSDPAADYDQSSYTYTPAGDLAGLTDAAGNTWSYTYDLLGDRLTQTDPDTGTTTSTYDAAQQLITVTDARGKQVSYTYDADGRKTAEYDTTGGAAESSSDQLASLTYDTLAKGKLTSSTADQNGASYTEEVTGYDSYGLPSGTETIIPSARGALAGTYTQQDSYAPDGQLTSYTDSAAGGLPAETVTTGYNTAGQADSLTGAGTYVDSLSYSNLAQPLQYTMGTAGEPVYLTDSYDPQTYRLTEQDTQDGTSQSSVDDLHYTYDDVGDVTSEADTPAGNNSATDVQCFAYDYLGRLTQAWAQGSTGCAATPSASAEGGTAPYWESYTYNTIGNLTGIASTTPSGAVTTTADSYPAAGSGRPHAVTTAKVTASSGTTTTSYAYDADGNLTTVTGPSQSQALTWNDAGQLSQDAVTASGGSAQDTGYTYDADGNLLLTTDPGITTLYLPDEQLSLNTSTGTVTGTRFYTLNGVTVAARTGASSLAYLAGDQEGTDAIAINSATLAITRRYYDP